RSGGRSTLEIPRLRSRYLSSWCPESRVRQRATLRRPEFAPHHRDGPYLVATFEAPTRLTEYLVSLVLGCSTGNTFRRKSLSILDSQETGSLAVVGPQRAHTVSTPRQRWTFLAVISAALFLIGADNSILYTALPELRTQLDTTPLEGLWIINAYPLVLSGLLLGTGTLGDRIGHRLMFLVGVSI